MSRHLGFLAVPAAGARGLPARPAGVHLLACDASLRVSDCVCQHGVRSPALGGEFRRPALTVLLSGAFHTRTSGGAALVGAGTLVLGNPAGGYENRHVDDGGDRSLVFEYGEGVLEAAARSLQVRLSPARPFRGVAVPASAATAAAVTLAHLAVRSGDAEALREAGLVALAAALELQAEGAVRAPLTAQARAVAGVLRHVEADVAGDLSLEALAARAALSPFHFVRVFRALTGQTPRQHVIATRLRVAATALRTTDARITDVALDAGFGDLSHFVHGFRRAFGVSPRAYRRVTGPAPSGPSGRRKG